MSSLLTVIPLIFPCGVEKIPKPVIRLSYNLKLIFNLFFSMPYTANADTLFNMAVDALGKYVSQFMKLMIETTSEPRGADLQYHHYQGPCNRLEDLLTRVPTTRAREVTLVLIGQVNRVYTELVAKPNFRDACEEIAPLVLKSVIHPSVKNLECIRYYPHREIT
jgi:hypothetical protein